MIGKTIQIPSLQEKKSFPFSFKELIEKEREQLRLYLRARKYERKEDIGGVAYIREQVKPGNIVFDIGAHKGGYLSIFLQQLKGKGCVYAFEPQSVLYRYLALISHLFDWRSLVLEPYAVSAETGKAVLSIPYNGGHPSSPCATIIESNMNFRISAREEVNTVSLDAYCSRQGIVPDFLKVDVEGNELSVFRGAENILRTCKPKILFECEARFVGEAKVYETFSFLQSLGYEGYFIRGAELLPIKSFSVATHQTSTKGCYCNNFIFE